MNKIFLIISFIFLTTLPSLADFLPNYVNQKYNLGIGVVAIKNNVQVFETNDNKGLPLAIIGVNNFTLRGVDRALEEDIYLARKQKDNLALLSVEIDTDDWFYVCYNHKHKLYGWVKKDENIDFLSWKDFFDLYGRKKGIYIYSNVDSKYKGMYSKPDLNSTRVDNFKHSKHVSLWLVSGDWMLVKVTTYDNQTKTGWIKWKTDDGALLAFPNFYN